MGKKCVKVVQGIAKTPRNIYLDDIRKAYSHQKKKTPKLPKYEADDDLITMSAEIRKHSFGINAINFAS